MITDVYTNSLLKHDYDMLKTNFPTAKSHLEHLTKFNYPTSYFMFLVEMSIEDKNIAIANKILDCFDVPSDSLSLDERISYYYLLRNFNE